MITIERLAFWMTDLVTNIVLVEGRLFIDRFDRGATGIRLEFSKYASIDEAQRWINIVPLSDFISEVIGDDWELDDPALAKLLSIYERAWKFQISALYPGLTFQVERWAEEDAGDIGLRLVQQSPSPG